MMERSRPDDDSNELESLLSAARVRFAVAPLPAAYVDRFRIPPRLAFAIVRIIGGKVATPPLMTVIAREDANGRVARLNAPGRADGFHRWN